MVDPLIRSYVFTRGTDVSCLEWFSAIANLGGQKMISLKEWTGPHAAGDGQDA